MQWFKKLLLIVGFLVCFVSLKSQTANIYTIIKEKYDEYVTYVEQGNFRLADRTQRQLLRSISLLELYSVSLLEGESDSAAIVKNELDALYGVELDSISVSQITLSEAEVEAYIDGDEAVFSAWDKNASDDLSQTDLSGIRDSSSMFNDSIINYYQDLVRHFDSIVVLSNRTIAHLDSIININNEQLTEKQRVNDSISVLNTRINASSNLDDTYPPVVTISNYTVDSNSIVIPYNTNEQGFINYANILEGGSVGSYTSVYISEGSSNLNITGLTSSTDYITYLFFSDLYNNNTDTSVIPFTTESLIQYTTTDSGVIVVFSETFESYAIDSFENGDQNWTISRLNSWKANDDSRIVDSSGTNGKRWHYGIDAGFNGGTSSSEGSFEFVIDLDQDYTELYIQADIQVIPGFGSSYSTAGKMGFGGTSNKYVSSRRPTNQCCDNGGWNCFGLDLRDSTTMGWKEHLTFKPPDGILSTYGWYWNPSGPWNSCYNNQYTLNKTMTDLGNQLTTLTYRIKMNTPGISNGIMEIYANGEQLLAVDTIRYLTLSNSTDVLQGIWMSFFSGGSNTFLQHSWIEYDNIVAYYYTEDHVQYRPNLSESGRTLYNFKPGFDWNAGNSDTIIAVGSISDPLDTTASSQDTLFINFTGQGYDEFGWHSVYTTTTTKGLGDAITLTQTTTADRYTTNGTPDINFPGNVSDALHQFIGTSTEVRYDISGFEANENLTVEVLCSHSSSSTRITEVEFDGTTQTQDAANDNSTLITISGQADASGNIIVYIRPQGSYWAVYNGMRIIRTQAPVSSINSDTLYIAQNGSGNGLSSGQPMNLTSLQSSLAADTLQGYTLLFNKNDTLLGTLNINEDSIIIDAYGTGANPVFTSLQTQTGWTNHTGNIYYKDITGSPTQIRFLYLDDTLRLKGREPNNDTTFYYIDSSSANDRFVDAERNEATGYWDDATIVTQEQVYGDYPAWSILREEISSFNTNGTFILTAAGQYGIGANYGYFITDGINTLDTHGEWCYREDQGRVYIYLNTAPTNYTIEVSIYDDLITLTDNEVVTISNINLHSANEQSIVGTGLREIVIDSVTMINGYQAIDITGSAHVQVINCNVNNFTSNGIGFYRVDSSLIEDNIVTNISHDYTSAEDVAYGGNMKGISVGHEYLDPEGWTGSDSVVIKGNYLENIGYNGIDVVRSNKIYVQNNYVLDAMLLKHDGGAYYFWELDTMPETNENQIQYDSCVMTNNYFEFSENVAIQQNLNLPDSLSENGFYGYYLDDKCQYFRIENNVGIGAALNLFLHGNQHIQVIDNVLIGNQHTIQGIRSRTGGGDGFATIDIDITNNIVANYAMSGAYSMPIYLMEVTSDFNSGQNRYMLFNNNSGGYSADDIAYETTSGFGTFDYNITEWNSTSPRALGTDKDRLFSFSESGISDVDSVADIYYNFSKDSVTFAVNDTFGTGYVFYDIDSNVVSGSVTVQPYDNLFLMRTQYVAPLPLSSLETENFNTLSTPLESNSNWTISEVNEPSSSIAISTGTITGAYQYESIVYWSSNSFNDNQYSEIVITTKGTSSTDGVGVAVRASANDYYHLTILGDNTYELGKAVNGVWTQLTTGSQTFADNDTVKLEASGTTLRMYRNDVQFGSDVTDSDVSSGAPGVVGYGTGNASYADNWEGGAL